MCPISVKSYLVFPSSSSARGWLGRVCLVTHSCPTIHSTPIHSPDHSCLCYQCLSTETIHSTPNHSPNHSSALLFQLRLFILRPIILLIILQLCYKCFATEAIHSTLSVLLPPVCTLLNLSSSLWCVCLPLGTTTFIHPWSVHLPSNFGYIPSFTHGLYICHPIWLICHYSFMVYTFVIYSWLYVLCSVIDGFHLRSFILFSVILLPFV